MPIHPENGSQVLGCDCIPAVYVNKDVAAVITTPFSLIFLARHTDTSGTEVVNATAAGSAAVSLNIAATGTLVVHGTMGAGTPATVTLT